MRHGLEVLESRLLLAVRPLEFEAHSFGLELEPNDTMETATPLLEISLGAPCRMDGSNLIGICPPAVFRGSGRLGGGPHAALQDVDHFSFSVDSGSRVAVHLEGSAARPGAVLELVSANGTVLARTEAQPAGTDLAHRVALDYSVPDAATLYVRIRSAGDLPAEGLAYHLGATARTQRNVEREPNDTFETANEIALAWQVVPHVAAGPDWLPIRPVHASGSVHGELGNGPSSPDTDFFRFDTRPSMVVDVRVHGAGAESGELTIYNGDRQVVAQSDADEHGNISVSFSTESGGTYFASLHDLETIVCITDPCRTYSLEVRARQQLSNPFAEQEPNDSMDTANPIPLHSGLPRWDGVELDNGRRLIDDVAGEHGIGVVVDGRQWGHRTGRADVVECTVEPCEAKWLAGDDYFSVETGADRHYRAALSGPLARLGGSLTLLAHDGLTIASDDDATDGLSIEWDSTDAAEYFLIVRLSDEGLSKLNGECVTTESDVCRVATNYRLDVASGAIRNPIQGGDEHEPNDTLDTAHTLAMRELIRVPGESMRVGEARGIAGGPTSDQDAYQFEVRAGEHVRVDVQGLVRDLIPRPLDVWLKDHGLNELGDAIDTQYPGQGAKFADRAGAALDRIESVLAKHPEIDLRRFEVTVYDSSGAEVGSTQSGQPGAVTFEAAANGVYYAVVKAVDSSIIDAPGHYRLGVVARSRFTDDQVRPDPEPGGERADADRAVVVIGAGKPFQYTDSSGDAVQILLSGRRGQATVTFTDADPNGSDIVSVEIAGVKRKAGLTIETAGSAEVGSIEIQGMSEKSRRRAGSLDTVRIDGNVGQIASALDVRSLLVAGSLGDVQAQGRQFREVRAQLFDIAMSDVGSIRSLVVDRDADESMFQDLLPWQ